MDTATGAIDDHALTPSATREMEPQAVLAQIGRKIWQEAASSHQRSLTKTAIIGPGLTARSFDRHQLEAALVIRCRKRVIALGMPVTARIT